MFQLLLLAWATVAFVSVKQVVCRSFFVLPHARTASRSSTARFLWDVSRAKSGREQVNTLDTADQPTVTLPLIEELTTNARKIPVTGPGVDERSQSLAPEVFRDEQVDALERIFKNQRMHSLLGLLQGADLGQSEKLRRLAAAALDDLVPAALVADPGAVAVVAHVRPVSLASGKMFNDWGFDMMA